MKLTKEEQDFVNNVADALLEARAEAHDRMAEEMRPEFDEEGLPEHKREGYAERMYEAADMERKRLREEGL